MFKKTAMIAAAFATVIAFMPAKAGAGSKTGHFIGGVAAGIGGLLVLKALNKSHRNSDYSGATPAYKPVHYRSHRRAYRPSHRRTYRSHRRAYRHNYVPAPRYARPAPRVRYYQPVSNCRSTNAALRKLGRRGFHSFHNIRYRNYTTKVKAWRSGVHYQIKVNRCSGGIIWSQAI